MNNKDKYKIFDRDTVKYIAIALMFVGHTVAWINLMNNPHDDYAAYKLPVGLIILSFMSLFCPPVMFFFIGDGYKYTRDRKKYALRLFVFACITQPFHWLLFQPVNGWRSTNVMFTLFFGLLSIMAWESRYKLWQRILLIILCDIATVAIYSDWLLMGVPFILFLYIFREQPKKRFIAYIILTLLHFVPNIFSIGKVPAYKIIVSITVMILVFMAAYACMTVLYNGKKGKHPVFAKWFFYAFYPAHHAVIYLIKILTDK